MSVVKLEVADRIAIVTLNRPEARNALNRAVRRQLPEAITACEADDGVDVVILTGADPAFCAGVDLKEFGSGGPTAAGVGFADMGRRDAAGRLPTRARSRPARSCSSARSTGSRSRVGSSSRSRDFLVASERARFADTHARRRDAGLGAHGAARAADRCGPGAR